MSFVGWESSELSKLANEENKRKAISKRWKLPDFSRGTAHRIEVIHSTKHLKSNFLIKMP
jgi:hypothetical protein